jgi:hypothetical protein
MQQVRRISRRIWPRIVVSLICRHHASRFLSAARRGPSHGVCGSLGPEVQTQTSLHAVRVNQGGELEVQPLKGGSIRTHRSWSLNGYTFSCGIFGVPIGTPPRHHVCLLLITTGSDDRRSYSLQRLNAQASDVMVSFAIGCCHAPTGHSYQNAL